MADTYDDPNIDVRKRWALQMMQNATNGAPQGGGPLAALARALQGGIGGYVAGQADRDERQALSNAVANYPGFSGTAPTATPSISPDQPRGIRNNNPGNIEDGPFAKSIPGYAGSDGRFAKFDSPQGGATAMDSLLASYGARGINTVGGVINRWAPQSDNNPTGAYASTVAKQIGVDPNAPIDLSDPAIRSKLGSAIGQFENGRPVQVAQAGTPAAPGVWQGGPTMRMAPGAPAGVQAFVAQNIGSQSPAVRALAMHALQQYGGPKDQWVQQTNPDGSIYQRNLTTGEMKAVEKSDVLPQAAVDQKVAIAAAGKPVTTIDQRAPDEFEKEYGQGMGKRALDVISQGDAATQDLQNSALSRSFLQKVKTGKLAPTQATVGAWAKAVGIDPAKLGIDPNLPAISQAAQSAIAQQTVSMIGAGGFPANNFSDADRKFLNSIPANMGNTPEANELLADVKDRIAQRKIDRANAWAEARDQKIPYEKFESQWRKKVAGEDMFADVKAKVDALQGGGWQDIGGVQIRKKQ